MCASTKALGWWKHTLRPISSVDEWDMGVTFIDRLLANLELFVDPSQF